MKRRSFMLALIAAVPVLFRGKASGKSVFVSCVDPDFQRLPEEEPKLYKQFLSEEEIDSCGNMFLRVWADVVIPTALSSYYDMVHIAGCGSRLVPLTTDKTKMALWIKAIKFTEEAKQATVVYTFNHPNHKPLAITRRGLGVVFTADELDSFSPKAATALLQNMVNAFEKRSTYFPEAGAYPPPLAATEFLNV